MKFFKRYSVLITLSFLVLILVTGMFWWLQPGESFAYADEIYQKCKDFTDTKARDCFTKEVMDRVKRNPQVTNKVLDQLYLGINRGRYELDGRILTDPTHYSGMTLAGLDLEPQEAFELCSMITKQGCIHGVVMDYVEYQGIISTAELKNFCVPFDVEFEVYINCIHAIGHELHAMNFDGSNLNEVLELCTYDLINDACISGVLMEYSTWNGVIGSHSHEEVLKNDLECEKYPDSYQEICVLSKASYMVIYPGRSYEQAVNYCREQQTVHPDNCLMMIAERIIIAAAENADLVENICRSISNWDSESCLKLSQQASQEFFSNNWLSLNLWFKQI